MKKQFSKFYELANPIKKDWSKKTQLINIPDDLFNHLSQMTKTGKFKLK
jgi:hypothetical protein